MLKELSLGGLIGLLAGIGLVTWVEPATTAGAGLLLLVCIALGTAIGGIVSAVKEKKGQKTDG
jgi:hypothetical protein